MQDATTYRLANNPKVYGGHESSLLQRFWDAGIAGKKIMRVVMPNGELKDYPVECPIGNESPEYKMFKLLLYTETFEDCGSVVEFLDN